MNKIPRLLLAGILFLTAGDAVRGQTPVTGSEFAAKAAGLCAGAREKLIAETLLNGGLPDFMTRFARIDAAISDSGGNIISAYYYVMPDYLCIGTDSDFVRMPMQPKTAQRIADAFNCFLSTKKICDDVYRSATVKLEPRPMTADRDSFHTFITHHRLIEEQRQGRNGLIAGHKKDVIITHRLLTGHHPDRVALYGWHKPDGTPIQPVYTGHLDRYVDYSHGFRLVLRTIFINDEALDYAEVMKHPVYRELISDEDECGFLAYPY